MKTAALYIVFAILAASCTKQEIPAVRNTADSKSSIHYSRSLSNDHVYYFAVRSGNEMNDAEYHWSINGEPVQNTGTQFQHRFGAAGQYTISAFAGADAAVAAITISVPPAR